MLVFLKQAFFSPMRVVGIYKGQDLIFSTGEVNPLIYNIIRGFADIGRRLYGEGLSSIKMGLYTVSTVECSENVFAFSIEDGTRGDRSLLDRACEAYKEYEANGNSDAFLSVSLGKK